MGVYLNPLDFPDDWNRCQIAGMTTPGKCKMGKWERKADYDHKKGKGTKGADQTLKELPPAEGEAEFWAWTPDHFAAWNPILDALKFDPSKLGGTVTPKAPASAVSAFTGNTPNASATGNAAPALSAAYAIDFFHPACADLDVSYVLPPESIGSWEEDGEASGLWKRTIKFVEFTGAPPNTSIAATPTGAADANTPQLGATPAGGTDPTATSAGAGSAAGAGQDAQGAWGAS